MEISSYLEDENNFNADFILNSINILIKQSQGFRGNLKKKGRKNSTYHRGEGNYLAEYINNESAEILDRKLSKLLVELKYEV